MNISVRSHVMSGLAAVGACAIAIAPVEVPQPVVDPVGIDRTASARVLSGAQVEFAAAVRRMTATNDAAPISAKAQPAPLNAASDFIVNVWTAAVPWINYGVDLADYVLGFIPFGYLIGDQISIVWYSMGLPVANSFVLDLVAPVVDDPLNLSTWVNGLVAVGSTTVTSLINLGINEFNYFFGWLIPPIPPLPLATTVEPTATAEDAGLTAASSIEAEPVVDLPTDDPVSTAAAANEPETEEPTAKDIDESGEDQTEITPTTDSSPIVQAQGEVRGADVGPPSEADADQLADRSPSDKSDKPENETADTSAETPSSNDDGTESDTAKGDGGTE